MNSSGRTAEDPREKSPICAVCCAPRPISTSFRNARSPKLCRLACALPSRRPSDIASVTALAIVLLTTLGALPDTGAPGAKSGDGSRARSTASLRLRLAPTPAASCEDRSWVDSVSSNTPAACSRKLSCRICSASAALLRALVSFFTPSFCICVPAAIRATAAIAGGEHITPPPLTTRPRFGPGY